MSPQSTELNREGFGTVFEIDPLWPGLLVSAVTFFVTEECLEWANIPTPLQ